MESPLEELKKQKEYLISEFSEGKISKTFPEDYTEIMDHYFRRSLQESKTGHSLFSEKIAFAFAAVGGYGRMELCVHSDIDILILFGQKIPPRAKELAEEILFPLWNLGLDLGYGIRSIKDCLRLCRDDFGVLTSLMDGRFVCGDSPLYLALMESLQKNVISKRAIALSRWLEDRNKVRMDVFGDASYLLEPNLKEGIGGLRDYHHILWLARALFHLRTPRDLEYLGKLSHSEYEDLKSDLQFIWFIRNHLHQLSGRKNDRLGFENQEKIARKLGFQDQKYLLGVEQFLERLHAAMASIKTLHRSFVLTQLPRKRGIKNDLEPPTASSGLHLYQEEICFDSATAILSNPFLLMEVFEWSSTLGCPLSMEARRLVREFLYLLDDTFRGTHRVNHAFLNVISGENTFETLDQMFETGFLDAYIPEFARIKDRVQFDAYHIFPVGRHSLETIKHLKFLSSEREILLLDIFSDLANPEPLLLAALFHDIGKVEADHVQAGVATTQKILKRFGYAKEEMEDVLFLVGHHLLLVETATRRDLNDEKVVVQCARTVENTERLKMLYLLTWADSRATGPRAWNGWIANLVQELFFKIFHILEMEELATPRASQKVKQTMSEVRCLMTKRGEQRDPDDLFEVMSPPYILNTRPYDIVNHLLMVRQLKEYLKDPNASGFVLDAVENESESCWELTFLARDRPGLFSDLAGVLALNNISTLSAHIYTWREGTAVDIFKVTSPPDPINPDRTWNKIETDLEKTFCGRLSLSYCLEQKRAASILSNTKKPSRPPEVIVDNKTSDFFTLIEVFADKSVGLLYLITHTLFDLGLDIRVAKIATKGDQIADVFYVHDLEGQKLEDKRQVLQIETVLVNKLKQELYSEGGS